MIRVIRSDGVCVFQSVITLSTWQKEYRHFLSFQLAKTSRLNEVNLHTMIFAWPTSRACRRACSFGKLVGLILKSTITVATDLNGVLLHNYISLLLVPSGMHELKATTVYSTIFLSVFPCLKNKLSQFEPGRIRNNSIAQIVDLKLFTLPAFSNSLHHIS